MTLRQLERAKDIAGRCRQAAERAGADADRIRWSAAAETLELALRSRGYREGFPAAARLGAFFDEALERIIQATHAVAP